MIYQHFVFSTLFIALVSLVNGGYISIDQYTNAGCTGDVVLQLMTQTEVCIVAPVELDVIKSYKIKDVDFNEDTNKWELEVAYYGTTDCSGDEIDYDQEITALCSATGSKWAYHDKPISVKEKWPAVGTYIEAPECNVAPVTINAERPNTCNPNNAEQTSFKTTCADNKWESWGYNESTTCAAEQQNEYIELNTQECGYAGPIELFKFTNINVLALEFMQTLHSNVKPLATVVADGYYYGSCEGVESLPGVHKSSSSKDDELSSQELGLIIGFVIGGVVLIIAVAYFCIQISSNGDMGASRGARDFSKEIPFHGSL